MPDGTGVIVAILDSGISLNLPVFRKENGESKIISVWDQTAVYDSESAPNRYGLGRIFDSDEVNGAVGSREIARDPNGHGTAVAGIVAENAPGAEFIIVKLSGGNRAGFAKTTSIMFSVDYCANLARDLGRPCVINLSYGTNNGGHDGRSILETYLNHVAESYAISIVVATGNEGDTAHHKELDLRGVQAETGLISDSGVSDFSADFLMGENEQDLTLSVWMSFQDRFEIRLESPSGDSLTVMPGFDLAVLDNVRVAVFYGEPTPLNMSRELRFRWLEGVAPTGLWRLIFVPEEIRVGRVNMWLPVSEGLSGDTRFVEPTVDVTLTVPSTADGVISVGAFDANRNTLAAFSGRGFTRDGRIKPDVVAPGVDVGNYTLRSGTSFAAPFITARAAVLMDWGIVQGNDPFLYGEKLKAYIIREARPLAAIREYPDPAVGWGGVE